MNKTAQIDQEIQEEKNSLIEDDVMEDNFRESINVLTRDGFSKINDPSKRTKEDLVWVIAVLELKANELRAALKNGEYKNLTVGYLINNYDVPKWLHSILVENYSLDEILLDNCPVGKLENLLKDQDKMIEFERIYNFLNAGSNFMEYREICTIRKISDWADRNPEVFKLITTWIWG